MRIPERTENREQRTENSVPQCSIEHENLQNLIIERKELVREMRELRREVRERWKVNAVAVAALCAAIAFKGYIN